MAVTQNLYTGDGSTVLFSFTFPYIDDADVKVSLSGTDTTAYSLANATTVEMDAAPTLGQAVRVYRDTDDSALAATFYPGSAIRAADLNDNLEQVLFISQEVKAQSESTDAAAIAGVAQNALDAANAATATAAVALNTANAAETTADGIASTANTALSNSSAAVATANGIAATADTALSNSTAAVNAAATAVPLAGGTMTGNLTVPSLNGGPLAGFRNRIVNGNFDIWQRGNTTGTWIAPISNFYLPDRWVFSSGGTGGTGSLTQQAFTAGQTDVPGEPTYFMRWEITSAASGQTSGDSYVEQRIEDVRTLAGQAATISFYAKGTGTLPNIYLTQTFGSGGSAQVLFTLASSVALNASWTKYTYTVNVGSISGKTIGSNHYVGLTFMVPINSTYTLDLAQVQVEPGTVDTPFEHRSYGQELALCQRYYCTRPTVRFLVYGLAANTISTHISFPTEMMVSPTVTLSNVAYINTSAAIADNVSSGGFAINATPSTTAAAGITATFTASAEL